ncbi:MAG: hypothetical protein APF76_09845 [Desulfitibacter sp. BRH_c19]|nr:MAG: hypothetical protein APF76_09845 [Desulfitibacter sp. BRH_c19]
MSIIKKVKKIGIQTILKRLYSPRPLEQHIQKDMKSKKQKVEAFIDKELTFDKDKIIAAAIQVNLQLHKSTIEYYEHMKLLTEKAVNKGAQLITFPENIHFLLLGIIPMFEKQLNKEKSFIKQGSSNEMREQFFLLGPYIEKIFDLTFSTLARKYQVYIMAGSITVPVGNQISNIAYLYDPSGKCLGTQRKLHATPLEEGFGLDVGNELNVISLPFGKIAFPVCMDATYFETFYLAREQGADIVVIPIANNEEYDFYKAFRGTWHRVQEARVFGIKSALVGKMGDLVFTGKSGIFAPIDLTPQKDGVIQEAQTYDKEEIVVGEVDLATLRTYREEDPLLSDSNQELYDKYLSLYNPL